MKLNLVTHMLGILFVSGCSRSVLRLICLAKYSDLWPADFTTIYKESTTLYLKLAMIADCVKTTEHNTTHLQAEKCILPDPC